MQYKVQWRYKSSLGGPWMKGDVIDLREDLAMAVNIDSPGVLKEVAQPKVKEVDHEKHESDKKKGTGANNNRLGKAEMMREDSGQEVPVPTDDQKDPKLVGDRGKQEPIDKETFKAVKDRD